jgi:hypothetical protein
MELPRWAVVSMLTTCAIAILAVAGWWWVTWPERTAHEFVRRLTTQDESWTDLVQPSVRPLWPTLLNMFAPKDINDVEPQPRSTADIILGRRAYRMAGEFGWVFTVERGVIIDPTDGFVGTIEWEVQTAIENEKNAQSE